jgi:hypothetical protein
MYLPPDNICINVGALLGKMTPSTQKEICRHPRYWHVGLTHFYFAASLTAVARNKLDIMRLQGVRWDSCVNEPAGNSTNFTIKVNYNNELGTWFIRQYVMHCDKWVPSQHGRARPQDAEREPDSRYGGQMQKYGISCRGQAKTVIFSITFVRMVYNLFPRKKKAVHHDY